VAIEYLDGESSSPGPLGASATMRSRSLGVAHTELPPLYRISQPLPKISLTIYPLVSTRTSSWFASGKGSKLRRKKEAASSEGSRTSLPLCGLL
jgi:hypothetical protein